MASVEAARVGAEGGACGAMTHIYTGEFSLKYILIHDSS